MSAVKKVRCINPNLKLHIGSIYYITPLNGQDKFTTHCRVYVDKELSAFIGTFFYTRFQKIDDFKSFNPFKVIVE